MWSIPPETLRLSHLHVYCGPCLLLIVDMICIFKLAAVWGFSSLLCLEKSHYSILQTIKWLLFSFSVRLWCLHVPSSPPSFQFSYWTSYAQSSRTSFSTLPDSPHFLTGTNRTIAGKFVISHRASNTSEQRGFFSSQSAFYSDNVIKSINTTVYRLLHTFGDLPLHILL